MSSGTWSAATRSAVPARNGSASIPATSTDLDRRCPRRRRRRCAPASTTSCWSGSGDRSTRCTTSAPTPAGRCRGPVVDGCIECPWHGSRFRLDRWPVAQRARGLRPAGLRDPGRRGRRIRGPPRSDRLIARPIAARRPERGIIRRWRLVHPRPQPRRPRSARPARASRRSRLGLFDPDEIVSSDALRAVVSGDDADQARRGRPSDRLHRELAERLADGG